MRKIALALSTILALSSCSQKDLSVNPSSDTKIVRKNEREGIVDLRRLVEESEVEEAWVYISPTVEDAWYYHPIIPEWHDIGLEAKTKDGMSSVELDIPKIKGLGDLYSSIHVWHIHPQKAIRELYSSFLDDPPKGLTKEQFAEKITLEGAIPSRNDLTLAIYFNCILNSQRSHYDRYFLASHYGITEFQPISSNLVNVCQSSEPSLSLKAKKLGLLLEASYDDFRMRTKIKQAVNTRTSAELFHKEYMKITFWPYAALPTDLK